MTACRLVFQSSGHPSRFVKTVVMPVLEKQCYGVFNILIEIGIEDPLVHEVHAIPGIKQNPTQVVELERGQYMRISFDHMLRLSCHSHERFVPCQV